MDRLGIIDGSLICFLGDERMRKIGMLSLVLLVGGIILTLFLHRLPRVSSAPLRPITSPSPAVIQYQMDALPQADVHTLWIPMSHHPLPVISPTLATVAQFAEREGAIAVLNAGFFDPQNQKSTSYITLNGELVADPRQNERLMDNPNLAPYLDRVLNRTELRRYQCDGGDRFDFVRHLDRSPVNCQIGDAIGGGPQLLPELTLEQEGFFDVANGEVIRDPLGSRQPNARTAVGLKGDQMVWVMVAQKSDGSGGMSLGELAEFMKGLGVEKAMNLDGGISSALYYEGKVFYGKGDGQGAARPVKSVLLIR
jgi:Phosphodiester glycosidase